MILVFLAPSSAIFNERYVHDLLSGAETYPTYRSMAWDSSSSSDEPLQQRASRRILSGRTPRQIPRLLVADSSDEEVSPKIVKRGDEKDEKPEQNETGDHGDRTDLSDSIDGSATKGLALASEKLAPEKPENIVENIVENSNVAAVCDSSQLVASRNSERSEPKSKVAVRTLYLNTFQSFSIILVWAHDIAGFIREIKWSPLAFELMAAFSKKSWDELGILKELDPRLGSRRCFSGRAGASKPKMAELWTLWRETARTGQKVCLLGLQTFPTGVPSRSAR